jgi:multiple sugar transport system permease protein
MAISNNSEKVRDTTIAYIITIVSIILFAYPIAQFLLTSLKPTRGLLWSIWPESFTWQNYLIVLKSNTFQAAMINSILISALATIIVVGVGILAAYALSNFEFKQRENIAFFILSLYIIPPIVTIIPTWIMAQAFGLLDQWWFLALVYAFCNLPFTVWLLRNFLIGVPKEIQEAALVDGCTKLKTLSKVLVPIILPGLAVAAIFSFIFSWNEFLFGVILTNTQARTIPVEIASQVSYFVEWGKLSSMTMISILPVLCLSIFLQRYLVMGLTLGSVKE